MNKRLLLVLFALAPACVFTDLAELPPPISVVNNPEPDLVEDVSGDMDVTDMPEMCTVAPTPLTTDPITHFAADRFDNVVFYAARLSTGVIQLGRIDGDSISSSFANANISGAGIHSISVAAISRDRMLFAVLRDETRIVNVWSCSDRCTSFGTTGLQSIAEMQLASGTPPSIGVVRGFTPPNQEFIVLPIDLGMNAILPGQVLSATLMSGVEGVSFAAGVGEDYRVAFGSPDRGYYTAFGNGLLEPERCLTFERRMMDPYFTRVKRLNETLLIRGEGLNLTNCADELRLTNHRPRDADFALLTGTQQFAVWPEPVAGVERVLGALVENGAIARRVDLGVWQDVSHVRTFRTQTELMVLFGGLGTHLQLLRATPQDLVTCFRND